MGPVFGVYDLAELVASGRQARGTWWRRDVKTDIFDGDRCSCL